MMHKNRKLHGFIPRGLCGLRQPVAGTVGATMQYVHWAVGKLAVGGVSAAFPFSQSLVVRRRCVTALPRHQ